MSYDSQHTVDEDAAWRRVREWIAELEASKVERLAKQNVYAHDSDWPLHVCPDEFRTDT